MKGAQRIVGRLSLCLLSCTVWLVPLEATTINVDETAPGSEVADNGRCSLREAIENANSDTQNGRTSGGECEAGSGADTIVLPAGVTFTLPDAAVVDATFGASGLPHITSTITIQGNGATITRDASLVCTLDDTRTADEFRIFFVEGGGDDDLTLEDLALTNGCADGTGAERDGAGIVNRGRLTLRRSTLSGHQASFGGGGIINGGGGTTLVESSTLSGNFSVQGGAIEANDGTVTVLNSTLSGNSADIGGGIFNTAANIALEQVTFFDNEASSGAGGGIYSISSTVNAKNVILIGSSCFNDDFTPWSAEGANFDSGPTCGSLSTFATNFTGNATLALGPLADNGGPTQTHALLSGSAAIDAVGAADCTRFGSATTIDADQRGISRPQDGDGDATPLCDAGAYEFLRAAAPATIQVDVDALGDGVVGWDATDGLCSIREAVDNANDTATGLVHADCEAGFPGGADTIVLPAGLTFTLPDAAVSDANGNTGLPYVTSTITIEGSGSTIERDPALGCNLDGTLAATEFRLFLVAAGGVVTLRDVTLRGGCVDSFSSNVLSGGGEGDGGAMVVAQTASATLESSAVIGNRARMGGGVIGFGPVLIDRSTFAMNEASADAGAIFITGGTLRNSTFSSNHAGRDGGALVTYLDNTIEHVTFLDNTFGTGGYGGGIFNLDSIGASLPHFRNVIVKNTSCVTNLDPDPTPIWSASGSNFDDGLTCASLMSNFTGNATLSLGPLTDNGGSTMTHELLPGSDAIDGVDAADCSLAADQRGVARPQDGDRNAVALCDAGAFEVAFIAATTPQTISVDTDPLGAGVVDVDPNDGRCSIREAIDNANDTATGLLHVDCIAGYPGGADTIVLPANATFTLTDAAVDDVRLGSTGLPHVTSTIAIEGNGSTITRDPSFVCTLDGTRTVDEFRILLSSGDLTVEDVTVTNGCADGTYLEARGGGIFNSGALTVRRSTLSVNHAYDRGGAISGERATTLVETSTVSGNSAAVSFGGGVFGWGGTVLRNSTVSGNRAFSGGGVVIYRSSGTLDHVTLVDNTDDVSGHGLVNAGGDLNVTNIILSNSSCGRYGTNPYTASGANFDDGTSCEALFGSNFTSNAMLNLGPLADNGGLTYTHALLQGSDGIDAVPEADCSIATDQRGEIRALDGNGDATARCDAGAFEVGGISIDDVSVTEDPTTAGFVLSRGAATVGDATVQIETSDGTATAALDYTGVPAQTVTIPDGQSSISLSVIIAEDLIDEGVSEEFLVNLSNPTNAVIADGQGVGTIIDDDTAELSIDDVTVTEGDTGTVDATFTVGLSTTASSDVTVDVATADDTATAGSDYTAIPTTTLTFTPGETSKSVAVTVHGDMIDEGASEAFLVNLSNASHPIADGQGLGTITDDDIAGVTLSKAAVATSETGTTDSFTAVLDAEPTADVILTVTAGDTTEGRLTDVDETDQGSVTLTFTMANWNVAQMVTVTGQDDALTDGNQAYNITTTTASADPLWDGLAVVNVSATNNDDDAPGVDVTPVSGLVTTEAGGTATFDVVLNAEPAADVMIDFTSSDMTEGLVSSDGVTEQSSVTLTFTPAAWDVPQTVMVHGQDDLVTDGDQGYSITSSAAISTDATWNGIAVGDVAVTNEDDEVSSITVSPTLGLVTTEAGGTDTFTIVLTSRPTADVMIALSSSDTAEGSVSPTSVTFTSADWDVAQMVTVTGVDDRIADGDQPYTIVTGAAASADPGYDGLAVADVGVTNIDIGLPGDANGDGAVSVADIFYLINHLFAGGPPPIGNGDANGDDAATVDDIFYLINYLFAGGPAPV